MKENHKLTYRRKIYESREYTQFQFNNYISEITNQSRFVGNHLEIGWGNATAVVDDLKVVLAIVTEVNLYAGGSGVDTVLDKLLDSRGEVQDDLPGADSVNHAPVNGSYQRRACRRRRISLHFQTPKQIDSNLFTSTWECESKIPRSVNCRQNRS